MRIKSIALVLGTLVALGVGACNDSEDVVFAVPHFGTFVLRTLNGTGVPVTIDSATPNRVEVISGVFTINVNNTFSETTTFRQTVGAVVTTRTRICIGTFRAAASDVIFVETSPGPECGRTFNGVLTSTRLTTSLQGLPALYTK